MANHWDDNTQINEAFDLVFERIPDTIDYKEKWAACAKPENAIVNDPDIPSEERRPYKTCDDEGQRAIIIPTELGNVVLYEKTHPLAGTVVTVASPHTLVSCSLVPPAVITYAGEIKRICGEASRPNIGEAVDRLTEVVLEYNSQSRPEHGFRDTIMKLVK